MAILNIQLIWAVALTSLFASVDAQYSNSSSNSVPVVSQISDAQPQAGTSTVSVITQISDAQPQAPSSTTVPVVSQISDAQPQAPSYSTVPVITQISDAQPQAPPPSSTAVASYSTVPVVSQTSDGQPQGPTSTAIASYSTSSAGVSSSSAAVSSASVPVSSASATTSAAAAPTTASSSSVCTCPASSSSSSSTYPVATSIPSFSAFSPPKYPSPQGRGLDSWADAYEKARAIVSQMTLLEKVNITTGTGWQSDRCVGNTGGAARLGIEGFCMQDSPLGVRFGQYASAFPAGVSIASTWSRDLFYRRGRAMGMEHKMKGVTIQLGPVSGPLGRYPEGGRNWEGGGSDPYLSGVGLAMASSGIQDSGVIACAKHYILNEQEHFRQSGESAIFVNQSLSSNIDDRALHEVYLWPFADAVRAGVGAIMCSYNQINNSYGCQNSYLLNGLLKDELDFQGFVMSDWGAQHAGVATALAGLDMAMPGDKAFVSGDAYWGANLTIAVLNGSVPEWRLNDMATRIMAAFYKVGGDVDFTEVNFDSWTTDVDGFRRFVAMEDYGVVNENVDVRGTHGQLIREIGAKGTVLLKNVNGALPLVKPRQVGVFGSDAGDNPLGPNGCADRGCSSGTIAMGWGSGTAMFPYLISPLTALQVRAAADGSVIQWVTDDYANVTQAATATQASVCLVFVKSDAGEGYITVDGNQGDRNNLTLWANGENLIQTVAANCNNTIVTIHAPGPVTMESWIDHPNITAVLFAGLPGQESGNSIVDVLYGRVNPAGRLPFTIAKNRADYGVDLMYTPDNYYAPQEDFTNALLIDYRYFDANDIAPRYEFGYGLSYTTFNYTNLVVTKQQVGAYTPFTGETLASTPNEPATDTASDYLFPEGFHEVPKFIYPYLNSTSEAGLDGTGSNGPAAAYDNAPQPQSPASGAPGGNPQLYDVLYKVSFTITNTGSIGGEEVPQLYVATGDPDAPPRVLRGFDRVSIDSGMSTTVTMDLTRRDVSYWDTESDNWAIGSAAKTVYVGGSSRNLPLSAALE